MIPTLSLPSLFAAGLMSLVVVGGCTSQSTSRRLPDAEPIPVSRNSPATVYLELATSYLDQGQAAPALNNAQKALALDPDNSEALILKGVAYSRLGYAEKAEASFQEALKKNAADPYAANAYGTFLCGQNRIEEATRQFESAAASPNNPAPWVALTNAGLCLRDKGNRAGAQARFQEALGRNARFGPALLALARLHYESKAYSEAQTHISRYFEVMSPDPESLFLAYRIEKAVGNRRAADSYALMLRSRYPGSSQTYQLLGL